MVGIFVVLGVYLVEVCMMVDVVCNIDIWID